MFDLLAHLGVLGVLLLLAHLAEHVVEHIADHLNLRPLLQLVVLLPKSHPRIGAELLLLLLLLQ